MSSDRAPDIALQTTASGSSHVTQVAGDQYNTVWTPGSGPAPQALAALPPAPHLVGRTAHTDELLGMLAPDGQGPGAVVTGLAGIGKTALVLHVAHQAVSCGFFPGGALFIALRGYAAAGPVTAEGAVGALLRALGIRDGDLPPTFEEQVGLYQSELASRADRHGPLLIVADDASTTAQLVPLVPAHPAHRLLITSRHALASPDLPARLLSLDQLAPGSAAALITGILTRTRPGDLRPQEEPQALERVTEHCGYLPLALTIAAALLTDDPGLPIATLADDFAGARTRLRALHHRERDGRSLAVRAAFDLSYQRLEAEHALLFRLLSLNPGPDLATEAAAALSGLPVRQTRESLAALARAGLIGEQPIGSGRWRMHDLTNLYSADLNQHLNEDEAQHQAFDRLLEHYRATTQAADRRLRALPAKPAPEGFSERAAARAWLDAERPNLTAVIPLAAATGRHARTVLSLSECLAFYLDEHRYFQDAAISAQQALAVAREVGNRDSEGRALTHLGNALAGARRFDEAIDAHTHAAAIFRELDDQELEEQALNNLGIALRQVRRFDESITVLTQGLAICHKLGDLPSEGKALINLGGALTDVRRFGEAITALTQAATICREIGDRTGEGKALINLGGALIDVRRFDEAITAYTDAAAIAREAGDLHSEGQALNGRGLALSDVRRFDEAITAYTDAAEIAREAGDLYGEGQTLNNLGIALRQVRRFDEAIDAHTQDLAISRQLGDRYGEGKTLHNLGVALREARRFDEAVTVLTQGAAIYREADDHRGEARVLNSLGVALREVRRFDEAVTILTEGAALAREAGDLRSEAQALNNLGLTLRRMRRIGEAFTVFTQAAVINRELAERNREARRTGGLRRIWRKGTRKAQTDAAP